LFILVSLAIGLGCGDKPTPHPDQTRNELRFVAEPFQIRTLDGLATLQGEIDFPAKAPKEALPLVLMVPGTGLFDRDVLFGWSGTERDFLFRSLAMAMTDAGYAVLRFDYRGVRCNPRTMPPCQECTPEQLQAHYADSCIESPVRATVTPENIEQDIAQLFGYARAHHRVDAERIILFAHSEGTIHTARLVGRGEISPAGILFMGMLADSPRSGLHWQAVGRIMRAMAWDANGDDLLTNEEIDAGFPTDPILSMLLTSPANLHSPTGAWTRESLESTLEEGYQQVRSDALSQADETPYPPPTGQPGEVVMASHRWWKWFFLDEVTSVEDLTRFPGPIIAHNGDIDSQTLGTREFAIVEPFLDRFAIEPRLVLEHGVGHGLGTHALAGPMLPEIEASLVADVNVLLGHSYVTGIEAVPGSTLD
jgi:pimeloyl-ACP methyl ester carboxylesterase